MIPSTSGRLYFPALDGLRTIAFAMVFVAHAFREPVSQVLGRQLAVLQGLFLNSADQGVALFFVLSGFLITHLLLEEEQRLGTIDIRAFYIRRILRIWPLYYASLLLAFVVWPFLSPSSHPNGRPWMYLAFLSNLEAIRISASGGHNPIYLGVTWSVAVEEQFYLAWPIFVAATRRGGRGAFFGVIILGSLLFRLAIRNTGAALYMHSISCASDLAVGGLTAWFLRKRPETIARVRALSLPVVVLGYCLVLLGLAVKDFVYLDQLFPGVALTAAGRVLQVALVTTRRLVFSLGFAFVIVDQLYGRHESLRLSRFPRLCRIGGLTYGLYLLHAHALVALIGLVDPQMPSSALATGLVALPFSVALAALSHRFLEQPFLRLKERFALVKSGRTNGPSR